MAIQASDADHDNAEERSVQASHAAPRGQGAAAIVRRHSRWYEVVLHGTLPQLLVGLLFVSGLPAQIRWGSMVWKYWPPVQLNTVLTVAAPFAATLLLLKSLRAIPGGARPAIIGTTTTGAFLVAFAVLLLWRLPYARSVLLAGYGLSLLWFYTGYFVGRRYRTLKIAALPSEQCRALESTENIDIRHLATPDFCGIRYDAVVADLRSRELGPEWQRFLAQSILAKLPVYDVQRVRESMTGRVQVNRLSENNAGALLPSPTYAVLKRIIDLIGSISALAPVLPIMAATAIAIRIDSPGPAIFKQTRVGLGNRDFVVYKFRSMRTDSEDKGAQFAATSDARITRVGRFIRKTRIDELPQLWNVLKGDMSLIGPRPEQRAFVDKFNEEIPFYIYRHVVRPGISGWAQVEQGYAASTEDTHLKLEYDLYYIKHFSLWLDILIVLKTLRVIMTGWGAR